MNEMKKYEFDDVKKEIENQFSKMKHRENIEMTILGLILSVPLYIKDVEILIKIFSENDFNVWIYWVAVFLLICSIVNLHMLSLSDSYKSFKPMTNDNEINFLSDRYSYSVNYLKKLQNNEKKICILFFYWFCLYRLLVAIRFRFSSLTTKVAFASLL